MSALNIMDNLEEIKEIVKKYESIKQQRRDAGKKQYHKTKGDPEKSYYLRNYEKCLEYDKNYKREKYKNDPEHREKIKERMRLYREKKRSEKTLKKANLLKESSNL